MLSNVTFCHFCLPPLLPPKHSDVINERPLTKNTLQFWKSNTNTFTHIHNLQLQRTSVTLTKFNHLSFQINSVFDFSAYTIRVKLRLNTNLSYHIAYQESLSPCRRCIYIYIYIYVQGSICFLLIFIEVCRRLWVTKLWFQNPL